MLPQKVTVSEALSSHFWFPLHTHSVLPQTPPQKINFSNIFKTNSLLTETQGPFLMRPLFRRQVFRKSFAGARIEDNLRWHQHDHKSISETSRHDSRLESQSFRFSINTYRFFRSCVQREPRLVPPALDEERRSLLEKLSVGS